MNDLTTFSKPEFGQVRTVEINGTPWLVGKDVAVALGYKNPSNAILKHVDDEDKRLEVLPQGGRYPKRGCALRELNGKRIVHRFRLH